ncbi:MAG: PspC domain-containing protein [Deltaproteobacteria bacterium]|nr:PspC domain-containing protein [Deltaproteobacteria bacterium]
MNLSTKPSPRFYRSNQGLILGVVAGFSRGLGLSPFIPRLILAALALFWTPIPIAIAYAVAAVIMPSESSLNDA